MGKKAFECFLFIVYMTCCTLGWNMAQWALGTDGHALDCYLCHDTVGCCWVAFRYVIKVIFCSS